MFSILLSTDSAVRCCALPWSENFHVVCRSCCCRYRLSERVRSFYHRRTTSCLARTKLTTPMENCTEWKKKKNDEGRQNIATNYACAHTHVVYRLLRRLFFPRSFSFSVLLAGGNLSKLCANRENLALVGPFTTNVSSNKARVGCPIPTS